MRDLLYTGVYKQAIVRLYCFQGYFFSLIAERPGEARVTGRSRDWAPYGEMGLGTCRWSKKYDWCWYKRAELVQDHDQPNMVVVYKDWSDLSAFGVAPLPHTTSLPVEREQGANPDAIKIVSDLIQRCGWSVLGMANIYIFGTQGYVRRGEGS